jgi:hypothetical protein
MQQTRKHESRKAAAEYRNRKQAIDYSDSILIREYRAAHLARRSA